MSVTRCGDCGVRCGCSPRSGDHHVPRARGLPLGLPRLGATPVVGSPRIGSDPVVDDGEQISRTRVERLMRLAGLSAGPKRKSRGTTIGIAGVRVANDLVDRKFAADAPNRVCVPTSPTCAPGRAGSTWSPGKTSTAAASSAGRWPTTCAQSSLPTRSRWRSPITASAGLIWHSDQGGARSSTPSKFSTTANDVTQAPSANAQCRLRKDTNRPSSRLTRPCPPNRGNSISAHRAG
jgi:hypothetical protein